MIILWAVATLMGITFLLIVFRGAPFIPTHQSDVEQLFKLYRFKKSDLLVDLGSGDGRVLAAAASRGIRAVGYDLNPFLVWYSSMRLRRYQPRPEVRLADFWSTKLPEDTSVVFVFLAKPFMTRLDDKLQHEATQLGHEIKLISYGIKVPDRTPETIEGAMVMYRYKP